MEKFFVYSLLRLPSFILLLMMSILCASINSIISEAIHQMHRHDRSPASCRTGWLPTDQIDIIIIVNTIPTLLQYSPT